MFVLFSSLASSRERLIGSSSRSTKRPRRRSGSVRQQGVRVSAHKRGRGCRHDRTYQPKFFEEADELRSVVGGPAMSVCHQRCESVAPSPSARISVLGAASVQQQAADGCTAHLSSGWRVISRGGSQCTRAATFRNHYAGLGNCWPFSRSGSKDAHIRPIRNEYAWLGYCRPFSCTRGHIHHCHCGRLPQPPGRYRTARRHPLRDRILSQPHTAKCRSPTIPLAIAENLG